MNQRFLQPPAPHAGLQNGQNSPVVSARRPYQIPYIVIIFT